MERTRRTRKKPGLGHQILVGEHVRVDDQTQGIPEDVRVVAVVEAPFQFLKITVQMFRTDLMERSDDRPLEQAPHALNAVGVDIADNPFLSGVVDGLMRVS